MADLKFIAESLAHRDNPVTVKINDRQGQPYLGLDGNPATIDVVGEEGLLYRRRMESLVQRSDELFTAAAADVPQLDRNEILSIAAGVVGWTGWDINGHPAELNDVNLIGLLLNRHIRLQLGVPIQKGTDPFVGGLASSFNGAGGKVGSVSPRATKRRT